MKRKIRQWLERTVRPKKGCLCVSVCDCGQLSLGQKGRRQYAYAEGPEGDALGDPERRKRVKGNGCEGKVSGWQWK